MYTRESFGIVVERANRRISIFNTNTFEVLQQLPIDADIIDVAINNNCTRAFVTSFSSMTMFQIDLCARPARVVGSAVTTTLLEDVALTPDGKYALSVDGSTPNPNIVSYSARQTITALWWTLGKVFPPGRTRSISFSAPAGSLPLWPTITATTAASAY